MALIGSHSKTSDEITKIYKNKVGLSLPIYSSRLFPLRVFEILVPLTWTDVGLSIGANLNKEDRASPSGGKYLGLVEE